MIEYDPLSVPSSAGSSARHFKFQGFKMRFTHVSVLRNFKFAGLLTGSAVALLFSLPGYAQSEQPEGALLPPPSVEGAVEVEASPDIPVPGDSGEAPVAKDAMDDLLNKIESEKKTEEAEAGSVPVLVPEATSESPPSAEALAVAPVQDSASPVAEIPALPVDKSVDQNLFFDANNLVPEGEMGSKGGPRKVDPLLEPASKLIVVKKNYTKNSRQAQIVSAQRAISLGRYDSALEMYNALYAKNKRDPNILMGRAISLQHMGQDDEAIRAYEELLDIHPGNVQAQVNMLGLVGQRYPSVGLRRLLELREKEPGNVAIIGQIAVLAANSGQNDEALKYLGMAMSMEPNNATHAYNMAVIADKMGHKEDAVKFYESALETDSIYGGGKDVPREAVYERLAQLR